MDKKIKAIMKTEEKAEKQTKSLLKADKKQDSKMKKGASCAAMTMHKKKK